MNLTQNSEPSSKIALLGAGVSGLSCAWWLKKSSPSLSVEILEKELRLGGKIDSLTKKGYVLENGPHVLLTGRPTTQEFLASTSHLATPYHANPAGMDNYVYQGEGKLKKYPQNISEALFKNPLSMSGLMRLLGEPFISGHKSRQDVSVLEFSNRRFGHEFTAKYINPLLNGIYGTTSEVASAQMVLPRYYYAERNSGSVGGPLVPEFFKRLEKGLPGKMSAEGTLTFKKGLKEWVDSLENILKAKAVVFSKDQTVTKIFSEQGKVIVGAKGLQKAYDSVVSCLPAVDLAPLIQQASPEASALMTEIDYVPLAVIYLAYTKEQVKHVSKGFGFSVPTSENVNINGCVYFSRVFEGKAPADCELFSIQMGGVHYPDVIGLSQDDLIAKGHSELSKVLKIKGQPVFTHAIKHTQALPVFRVGHSDKVKKIEQILKRDLPGFVLGGSGFHGTGMEKCIENTQQYARKVDNYLKFHQNQRVY